MSEQPDLLGAPPRRIGKSAAAFRTISEVATELDVPPHVLRFWETKFSSIKPLKRGGGRRYYRPEDIELLRRIRALLYQEGYTIKGAQKLLRDNRGGADAAAGEDDEEPEAPAMSDEIRAELDDILGELRALRALLPAAPDPT